MTQDVIARLAGKPRLSLIVRRVIRVHITTMKETMLKENLKRRRERSKLVKTRLLKRKEGKEGREWRKREREERSRLVK
jgi:hypothetical protein